MVFPEYNLRTTNNKKNTPFGYDGGNQARELNTETKDIKPKVEDILTIGQYTTQYSDIQPDGPLDLHDYIFVNKSNYTHRSYRVK